MGLLRRERKVLSWIGQGFVLAGRGLVGVGRVAAGGPTRRRVLLAALALMGGGGYLWVDVGLTRLLRLLVTFVFGIPAPGQPRPAAGWLPRTGCGPM